MVNTVGNLFAEAALEQVIATPLTLLSALCCYRLAIDTSRKQLKADPL